MKFINTKTHGFLDYLVGAFLIISPWVFGLDPTAPEGIIFIVLGVAAYIYSAVTNYELGLVKMLPMKTHLLMDVLSGILLAASPWIFGFNDRVYLPHLVLGLVEIMAGIFTKTTVSENTQGI